MKITAHKLTTHLSIFSASILFFFFSSRRRHTRFKCDWSSDVCSSDLARFLHRAEHWIQACEPARPPFTRDGLPRQDAISLQQNARSGTETLSPAGAGAHHVGGPRPTARGPRRRQPTQASLVLLPSGHQP